jgi:oligopeptide/dipeptide ABC transporter ATP-binding protein
VTIEEYVPLNEVGAEDERRRSSRLLEIDSLTIGFPTRAGMVHAVDNLTLAIGSHERVGLVGESGSGKTVMGLAMLGLIRQPGRLLSGDAKWRGESVFDPKVARRVRGTEIAMIFQDPMVSLNPLKTVGAQLLEILRTRCRLPKQAAMERAIELLERVGITPPRKRMKQYPYELSGGMRQRVMIATALAGEPALLVADEPTTGLDVTIQEQVLQLLMSISVEFGVSVVMITHDLGVVAEFCDRVQVLYGGQLVERAPVGPLFHSPAHPYTRGLLASMPRVDRDTGQLVTIAGEPLDRTTDHHGCVFSARCESAETHCWSKQPELLRIKGDRRWVACQPAQEEWGVMS